MKNKAEILSRKEYLKKWMEEVENNPDVSLFETERVKANCESRIDELNWILGIIE